MNDQVVSKGFGPNKKASKFAAANILLNLICPNIYKQWQEKVKSKQILTLAEKQQELLVSKRPDISLKKGVQKDSSNPQNNLSPLYRKSEENDVEMTNEGQKPFTG